MKQFLAFIFCVLALSVSAQDTQIRKGGGGAGGSATNAVATIRKDGTPIVNGATVIDFTNAAGSVVTVTADGTTARVGIPQGGALPSYVLTNADTRTVEFTSRITNSSSSGGGFWSSDSIGFISLSSATDYILMSQPQGGILATLDGWILGDANSTKTILSLSTNTSFFPSNLWVQGTNFAKQIKLTGGQAASSLLRLDSATNLAIVTVGANLSFDGTTLSATGGAGSGSTTQTNSGPYITETNKHFVDSLTVGWLATNTSGDLSLSPYVKNNSIASAQIQNSGVDTADININAVDGTKIAMGSDAAGDMLYYNGTDYVRLPRVATGRILQDNGSAPSWVSFDFKNAAASLTLTSVIEVRTTNNLELISGGTVGNGTRALLGLASNPALTGDPTAPTPTAGDNDTSIATTAFVTAGKSNMVTAEIGRLNITNGIVMTGAGSGGLDLVSGTSAKTFSISVPDSLTASSTNKFDFNSPTAGQVISVHSSSANVTVWTNATASGGGGSTTNALPVSLSINGGTGSTNIIVDMWQLAQMSTNSVTVTLTANAGLIVTNVVNGKELVIDVIQDSTGNRTIAQSSVGGAPLRFGTDITGFSLSTNGTYIDHIKLRGVGTNAHVVGMLRGYAP